MTVIAANRKEIAGDSRVACGSIYYNSDKVFRIGDSLIGVCGDADYTTRFLEWFRKECPDGETGFTLDDDHTFAALVLNSRGLFFYADIAPPDHLHNKFYAIGAGADIAMAAMSMGKSPSDAVRLACRLSPMACGLPVKVLQIPTGKVKRASTPLPPKGAQQDTPPATDSKGA